MFERDQLHKDIATLSVGPHNPGWIDSLERMVKFVNKHTEDPDKIPYLQRPKEDMKQNE